MVMDREKKNVLCDSADKWLRSRVMMVVVGEVVGAGRFLQVLIKV